MSETKAAASPKPTRTEKDSLGPLEVPADAYYGVQTARAVANFPISGERLHMEMVRAVTRIKIAAARANAELGVLDRKKADAIVAAAEEILAGKHDNQFVVDAYQAGAGTSFHMNVNEVIANRACELMGGKQGRPRPRPSERPRQHGPVDERRDPDRDAPRGARAGGTL